jgi:diaminohydroxyphosphoribosylaminopyrimidine deaminase/5-amino-6-(5-phosphoribosylamino)uracil reductase
VGKGGVAAPIDEHHIPAGFRPMRTMRFADDTYSEWIRGS